MALESLEETTLKNFVPDSAITQRYYSQKIPMAIVFETKPN